jgi:hypothetical protein
VLERNHRDIAAGVLLTLTGVAVALYAFSNYAMGTFTRMGPGMVPTWLGVVLAVFGVVIAVQGLFQPGEAVTVRGRVLLCLAASILCFAVMIERFGMVPTVFVSAIIATLAEAPVRPVRSLMLSVTLAALTWTIFILGLRLTMPTFDWPF